MKASDVRKLTILKREIGQNIATDFLVSNNAVASDITGAVSCRILNKFRWVKIPKGVPLLDGSQASEDYMINIIDAIESGALETSLLVLNFVVPDDGSEDDHFVTQEVIDTLADRIAKGIEKVNRLMGL